MKTSKTNHERVLNITFIALFAALCYIALSVFFFPFAHMYIHFGNLIVVAAALLIGGWQGGLAGSIGMGLYDILNSHIDSAPKTLILKFLIGLTVGVVFDLLRKREKYPSVALMVSGIVSLLVAAGLGVYMAVTGTAGKSAVLCPLFTVIGILTVLLSLLGNKFSVKTAAAIVGASCGMLVNIVGETAWKFVTFLLLGSDSGAAFTTALLAQGSTLINAGVAIVGGVALYTALRKPFSKFLAK